jgi:hypothetical protein
MNFDGKRQIVQHLFRLESIMIFLINFVYLADDTLNCEWEDLFDVRDNMCDYGIPV